jgi:hypothetical protein
MYNNIKGLLMRSKNLNYKDYWIKIGDNEVLQRVILKKGNNQIENGNVKKHLRLPWSSPRQRHSEDEYLRQQCRLRYGGKS